MSQIDPRDYMSQPEAAFAPGLIKERPLPGRLAAALARAQSNFESIIKDKVAKIRSERTGATYEYAYADLPQIFDKTRPHLNKEGIFVSQPIRWREGKPYSVTVLMFEDESWESDGVQLRTQVDLQTFRIDQVKAQRYDYCGILAIAAEEDSEAVDTKALLKRKSGRASGEGAATDGAEELSQTPPPPSGPELSPLERKQFIEQLTPYKDIAGSDPLKKFVLKHTGAKDVKSITGQGWQSVLAALAGAQAGNGATGVTALVNAD